VASLEDGERSLGRIEPESLAPEVCDELIILYRRWSVG
jgi:hypothetical protein